MWPHQHPKSSSFNVVIFGEHGTGKTCFADMFVHGSHFVYYNAVTPDTHQRDITVAGIACHVSTMDLNSKAMHDDDSFNRGYSERMLQNAHGIILLYNLASYESFHHITNQAYMSLWGCKNSTRSGRVVPHPDTFACILVGNKADLVVTNPETRQVSKDEAVEWARSQGMRHFEVTANSKQEVDGVMHALVEDIQAAHRRENEKDDVVNALDQPTKRSSKFKTILTRTTHRTWLRENW